MARRINNENNTFINYLHGIFHSILIEIDKGFIRISGCHLLTQ